MISSASSGGAGYSASGEVRLAARAAVIIALGSWPLPRAFPLAHDCPRPWPLLPLSVQNAGPVRCFNTPLNRRRTSAAAVGLRASLPLKMTSSMRSPRRLLALCSPITHVMASATLLLPHPFGPTIAVTPLSKASSERSENDLKPLISRRSKRMGTHHAYTLGRAQHPELRHKSCFLAGRQILSTVSSLFAIQKDGGRPRG